MRISDLGTRKRETNKTKQATRRYQRWCIDPKERTNERMTSEGISRNQGRPNRRANAKS